MLFVAPSGDGTMTALRFFLVLLALLVPLVMPAAEPEVDSVEKIWDAGKHNAFTDLIRWRDRWYCSFREGDAHEDSKVGLPHLPGVANHTAHIHGRGNQLA